MLAAAGSRSPQRAKKHRGGATERDDAQYEALVGHTLSLREQRARLTKAQADRVELETGLAQGKAVWLEDIERELVRRFSVFKQRVLTLPTALAPRVIGYKSPREVEVVLRESLEALLTELTDEQSFSESVQVEPSMVKGRRKSATPAQAKRVSVGGRKTRA